MQKIIEKVLGKRAKIERIRKRKGKERWIVMIVEFGEEEDAKEIIRRGRDKNEMGLG